MGFFFRAHGGDESGSHYLQALAAYLSRHYMQRDLATIYDMVNQYMSEIKQASHFITEDF